MALFNWADPFLIDKQLSSDEKMIMETASYHRTKDRQKNF